VVFSEESEVKRQFQQAHCLLPPFLPHAACSPFSARVLPTRPSRLDPTQE